MVKHIVNVTGPVPAVLSGYKGFDMLLQDNDTRQVEYVHVEVENDNYGDILKWKQALCLVDGDIDICSE